MQELSLVSQETANPRAPRVKICGIMRVADALIAEQSGADYMGVILDHPASPRSLSLEEAERVLRATSLRPVVVVVDMEQASLIQAAVRLNPYCLQLHGNERSGYVCSLRERLHCHIWKTLHLKARHDPGGEDEIVRSMAVTARAYKSAGAEAIVLDACVSTSDGFAYGGTGTTVDWELARRLVEALEMPVVLAGGLTPQNVHEAVCKVRPFAVDVSSGVESAPGIKDASRVTAFIREAKRCVE